MAEKTVAARRKTDFLRAFLLAAAFAAGTMAHTQTEDQTWLRHGYFHGMPPVPMRVQVLGRDPLENTAAKEIVNGIQRLWGSSPVIGKGDAEEAILVGTAQHESMKLTPR